jgi:formate dehydrogenase subunit gamma
MATDRRLHRFGRTERAVHWVHAVAFVVLLVTGLCLYLPSLAELVGRRPFVKSVHLYAAAGWAVALLLIFLAGDRAALRRTAREIDTFDRDDRAWLRRRRAPQGRLNAGQKLNAIASAAFALLFTVTGVLLWYGERDTRFRFAQTILIHDWLMYISFFLFIGHLYLAVINPATRHSLNGMTRGWVDRSWAERHHPKWAASFAAPTSPLGGDTADDRAGNDRAGGGPPAQRGAIG